MFKFMLSSCIEFSDYFACDEFTRNILHTNIRPTYLKTGLTGVKNLTFVEKNEGNGGVRLWITNGALIISSNWQVFRQLDKRHD